MKVLLKVAVHTPYSTARWFELPISAEKVQEEMGIYGEVFVLDYSDIGCRVDFKELSEFNYLAVRLKSMPDIVVKNLRRLVYNFDLKEILEKELVFYHDVKDDYDLGNHLVDTVFTDIPEHILGYINYELLGSDYASTHGIFYIDNFAVRVES